MKILSAILAIAFNLSAFEEQKMYIDETAIVCDQERIFLHLNQRWLETENIHQDERGYFVLAHEIKRFWYCSPCDMMNDYRILNCLRCGRPRR